LLLASALDIPLSARIRHPDAAMIARDPFASGAAAKKDFGKRGWTELIQIKHA